MNKRPLSVTIVSWLFIVVGVVGFFYHLWEALNAGAGAFYLPETGAILVTRLLAVVGGVFALRGRNWARWLLVVWLGCHVFISAEHSLAQMAFHAVLFGVIVFFLFRRKASAYFRGAKGG